MRTLRTAAHRHLSSGRQALIIVAHHEGDAVGTGQQRQPFILDGVGILKFIHQHVTEARAVVLEKRGIFLPDLVRTQQQLGEINDAAPPASLLVGVINLDQLAACRIAVILQVLGPQTLVFLRVDEPQDFTRDPAGLVEFERLQNLAQQACLILRVENLEALRQAGLAPMQPQQPVGETVEGAYPERPAGVPEQPLDTAAHFRGGLVGEGDREDAVRRDPLYLNEPGHAVHQHARLAAARAGQHQRRLERRGHRLALGIVQTIE